VVDSKEGGDAVDRGDLLPESFLRTAFQNETPKSLLADLDNLTKAFRVVGQSE
jgi:hypothetical protein